MLFNGIIMWKQKMKICSINLMSYSVVFCNHGHVVHMLPIVRTGEPCAVP